jgi:hypothetical protein
VYIVFLDLGDKMELKNDNGRETLVPDVEGGMILAYNRSDPSYCGAPEVTIGGRPHNADPNTKGTVEYYLTPIHNKRGAYVVKAGVTVHFEMNYRSTSFHGPTELLELHPPAAE